MELQTFVLTAQDCFGYTYSNPIPNDLKSGLMVLTDRLFSLADDQMK
jgi:hypothetical protein